MGGIGSGNWRGAPQDTAFWRLDIDRLKRTDCLRPGLVSISWKRRGESVASIRLLFSAELDRVTLIYRSRSHGEEWEDIRDPIPLDLTKPHFGGVRYWFICPGCKKRRKVLYGRRLYRCRECQRLTYASQYDPFPQQPWKRAHEVRERLGGQAGFSYPFPPKPKGMHWKTYYRLQEEDWRAEDLLCHAMNDHLLGIRRRYKL